MQKIIMDAERLAAEERKLPTPEALTEEEADGLDEPAEDTSPAVADGDGTLPEGEGENAEEDGNKGE